MDVVVRPARAQEWARAGELVATAYLADEVLQQGDPYLEHLRDAAGRARDSVVLVAVDGDTLLGTVTWCPVPSSHREVAMADEGEFRSLGVDPGARGRGIGRLLIEACVGRARQEGYAAVAISSAAWMAVAHRLYERMGFTRRPERDWAPRPDVSLLAYRLDLRGPVGAVGIREAVQDDEPFLIEMLSDAVNWLPERAVLGHAQIMDNPELAHYLMGWRRPTDVGVVAVQDQRPLGAAWWRYFTADDPGYAFVDPVVPEVSIGVVADRRGRGLGRALLRALVARARAHRIPAMSLGVERANPAQRLYLAEGFRVVQSFEAADTMLLRLDRMSPTPR